MTLNLIKRHLMWKFLHRTSIEKPSWEGGRDDVCSPVACRSPWPRLPSSRAFAKTKSFSIAKQEKATTTSSSSSSMMKTFPYILYEILNDDSRSKSPIMWLPHGRAFRMDKKKFATDVMPLYFKATKMSSFKRQLNLWGFKLIVCFGDEVLWRESFVKDHPEYLKSITLSCCIMGR